MLWSIFFQYIPSPVACVRFSSETWLNVNVYSFNLIPKSSKERIVNKHNKMILNYFDFGDEIRLYTLKVFLDEIFAVLLNSLQKITNLQDRMSNDQKEQPVVAVCSSSSKYWDFIWLNIYIEWCVYWPSVVKKGSRGKR